MRRITYQRITVFNVAVLMSTTLLTPSSAIYATTLTNSATSVLKEQHEMELEAAINSDNSITEIESSEPATEELKVGENPQVTDGNLEESPLSLDQEDDLKSELPSVSMDPSDSEGDQQLNEELSGEIAEVYTFAEFQAAWIDSEVSKIDVMNDIQRSTTTVLGDLTRSLVINGNGNEIHFNSNTNISHSLGATADGQPATLRIENARLTRVAGTNVLFTSTAANSANWTLELDNVTESGAITGSFASIPNGKVAFTGGNNSFSTTSANTQTFITAKKIEASAGAQISISRGNAVIFSSTVADSHIEVKDGAAFVIRTNTGTANNINLTGQDSKITLTDAATLDIESSGSGNQILFMSGARPEITVSGGSTFRAIMTGTNTAKRAVYLSGTTPKITVEDSLYTSWSATGISTGLANSDAEFTAINSEVTIQSTTGAGIHLNGTSPTMNVVGSDVQVNTTTGTGVYLQGANSYMNVQQSTVHVNSTNARSIWLAGNESQLDVHNGSEVILNPGSANGLTMHGASVVLNVSEQGTYFKATSTVAAGYLNGAMYLGAAANNTAVAGAKIEITDGAVVEATSTNASAIGVQSVAGEFLVKDGAELNLSSSSGNGEAATLRFLWHGQYQFTVDNAMFNVYKTGGTAAAIRMYGGNNHIEVINSGNFNVYNRGVLTGNPTDGGGDNSNQGIFYTVSGSTTNSFTVEGVGSKVDITAERGPAIDMAQATGKVSVLEHGFFQAVGITSSSTAGIFNAGVLTVNFDNPTFMDFRNNRSGGGNIFNVNASSTLTATNTDLSLWHNGTKLNGDPQRDWTYIDYILTGTNFNQIAQTNVPDEFNNGADSFGSAGLPSYSRLSSNNARAIVDELRVPTNADKSIFGHVSIPVGLYGMRSAWTDEVILTVEVRRTDGRIETYSDVKTVGYDDEKAGISIYRADPLPGYFQIELDEHLNEGDQVHVIDAYRGHPERPRYSINEDFMERSVETFQIIPPSPVTMERMEINNQTRVLRGRIDDLTAELSATYNQEELDMSEVVIQADGTFEMSIDHLTLTEGDEFQFFLRDRSGSALAAGVVDPPETTNNEVGNINPPIPLVFHDTEFPAAPIVTVIELTEVSPVDPLDPETEVTPENPSVLPENQGSLSIDFISQINFDEKLISVSDQTYFANPQLLLDFENNPLLDEPRPNYIQVSDYRSENDGWTLTVRQETSFRDEEGKDLRGAQLTFQHGQVDSVFEKAPSVVRSSVHLSSETQLLVQAKEGEGQGTWVYRLGDENTFDEGVKLDVPGSSLKAETSYTATLEWVLRSGPDNE